MNKLKNHKKAETKPLLCDVLLHENDLSLINELRNGQTSFAIVTLDENIFNDDLAHNLESFFEEKHISADMFNVEYMGFLTGQVKLNAQDIRVVIPIINEFLKNVT